MEDSDPVEPRMELICFQVRQKLKSSDVIVQDTIELLRSEVYEKSRQRWRTLPQLYDEEDTLDWLWALQNSGYIAALRNPPNSTFWNKSFGGISTENIAPERGRYFIWTEPHSTPRSFPIGTLILLLSGLALYILRHDFANIPWKVQIYTRDLKTNLATTLLQLSVFDILLFFNISPFLLVFIRSALFVVTHLFCNRGLWIFPNLLTAQTFMGPFSPIYEWDTNPKKSISLHWRRFQNTLFREMGILKERRRHKKRKINLSALKAKHKIRMQ